jgi:hypothetical protein
MAAGSKLKMVEVRGLNDWFYNVSAAPEKSVKYSPSLGICLTFHELAAIMPVIE